ncbi:phosphoglycerate mutase-like protein [Bimuria novae-zelandiae CBS 107.79]|uniref:Phosphoglycerate mutase-like protein n=1 Tax=Bimuria novae-zelandiae CBS 107.79 TaxID=1447943 RepID=A0A6A5URQ2_9PLEO|nr:phosphoglycerate mutase-like protein [Bimuria novae-zelandiae CBS 107.79]
MPPKKISIVRHGQGYHNVTHNYYLRDPLLTPLGHEQCTQLSATYPHHNSIDLVIASPIRRTIQTASFSFGPALVRREVPFLLDPKLQELGSHDADRGLDVHDLKAWLAETEKEGAGKVPFHWNKIDTSAVEEGWNSKKGYWAYEANAIYTRAADMRNALFGRSEDHVVLVTHGAIAHFLTEDWEVEDPMLGTNWSNCEVREFVFSETSKEGDAHLVEVEESRKRRPPYAGLKWEAPWTLSGDKDAHVVEEVEKVEQEGS